LNVASFDWHNALRVTRVLDANNKPLSAERVTQDSSIRVPFPDGLKTDASTTLTFEYEGGLESADDSPVPASSSPPSATTRLTPLCRTLVPCCRYGLNRSPQPSGVDGALAHARNRQRKIERRR